MSAHQALLPLGFSRQEHWSGLPFPSPMHESEKVKVKSLSHVWPSATPWTAAYQTPPSMGFSRQEYWSGVPLPSPKEATVRTKHGTTDWFQIGKGVHQGCVLSPCLFNLYTEYIMRNAGWMKHKLESRLLGEISIISDMKMTPPLLKKAKN